MKEQSLPFIAIGPAFFIAAAWLRVVCWLRAVQNVGVFCVGVLIGLIIDLLPHILYWNIGLYFLDVWSRVAVVGGQNMVGLDRSWISFVRRYGAGLVLNTEGRSVVLAWAFCSVVYQVIPVLLRKSSEVRPAFVLALAYGTAAVSVSGGARFFDHYYLYLLPFGIPLIAITIVEIVVHKSWTFVRLAAFICAAFLQAGWGSLRGYSADRYDVAIAGCAALTVAGLLFIVRRCRQTMPSRAIRRSTIAIGLVVFVSSLSVGLGQRQFHNLPSTDLSIQDHTIELCGVLESMREGGDQIFVWGWQTRLYPASKMVPGSQYVSMAPVVRDFATGQTLTAEIPVTPEMTELVKELTENRPRFIVDASLRSLSLSDRKIYELSRHLLFRSFLDENYVRQGKYGDYTLYVRRGMP